MASHEYWLLIAVSLPVLVIVAIQVVLFVAGERETLLLPSLEPFETIALSPQPEQSPVVRTVERRLAPPASLPPNLERRRPAVRKPELEAA